MGGTSASQVSLKALTSCGGSAALSAKGSTMPERWRTMARTSMGARRERRKRAQP